MIYVHLGFFMTFTYTFYTCKGKKNEKLKLYTNKLSNKRLFQSNEAKKVFQSKNKNNLDIDSYMKFLTQQNCKHLKVM